VKDQESMRAALAVAQEALRTGDVPVGAVILNEKNVIISQGCNKREDLDDPTAHAEIVAIRAATQSLGTWRLDGCTLVVTLEPCAMCAGAIAQSRISTLVFGAFDEKAGAVGSMWDLLRDPRSLHKVEVRSGVMADESSKILQDFFQNQRR
jgi:tRNA(adenine34) deaminase